MRQCSTVSDSTRRMKLSCAASNWSARRAERVVLESGMTQLSDALLGDRGLPAVVLAARPRSQGLEPISKQLDVLRAGHEIDFRQGEPVGSRRCGADLHRVTGLSQLGAGLLCQLLGGHVEVIDDLCRFLEIPTRLSQLLKGQLIKSPWLAGFFLSLLPKSHFMSLEVKGCRPLRVRLMRRRTGDGRGKDQSPCGHPRPQEHRVSPRRQGIRQTRARTHGASQWSRGSESTRADFSKFLGPAADKITPCK